MTTPYTIRSGDTLSAIARAHGITWQQLYNHPDNAAFRRRRPNPNLIYPGDVVMVPGNVGPGPTCFDYRVPGIVQVIRQRTSLVCWAAAYTMMRSWKHQQSFEPRYAVAAVDPRYGTMYDNNQGMPPTEFT